MNRHFILSVVFLLVAFVSFGQYQVQSKYFVYLQTEPAQPFYIKVNGQQINANASGYLILPQLKDGDYKLIVGFPQTKTPEQSFNFKIDSKDKGYLIKDYGAEGWGLLDLQSMAMQKANLPSEKKEVEVAKVTPKPVPADPVVEAKPKIEEKKEPVAAEGVSDFTKMLSQAANDPSLLEKPKPEPVEEKIVQEVKPKVEEKKEDAIASINSEKPKNTGTIADGEKKVMDEANIIAVSKSQDGLTVVYKNTDEAGKPDPITIFIPEEKKPVVEEKKLAEVPVVADKPEVANQENKTPIEVTTTSVTPIGTDIAKTVIEPKPATEVVQKLPSNCKAVASEDDFLKLRRAMANESNDENMIMQAKLSFDTKCYTTEQVKYLSSMFLSNAGKFHFFEAAKGHVSDAANFASLGALIKDQNYKDRFNALIQQ